MSRIPANSRKTGRLYLGGNRFRNEDGTISREYGYFTSPSGKESYCDPLTEEIVTLDAANAKEVGTIYKDDLIVYRPSKLIDTDELLREAAKLAGDKPKEAYIAETARKLGGVNAAD